MKITSSVIFAIFFLTSFNTISLDKVRTNYTKLISDKELCEKMIAELESAKTNSATHLAYLGGVQTIWANHVFSPISKLNSFKKGKENIEEAIRKEPNNTELRFIRLSVQKNAPSFLGYKSNVQEDTDFIKKRLREFDSEILKKNIELLLNE
ncbi:hypothetical protein AB670_03974 [Chryseobacterium sp. MOF25P]|uniref:hypothetical protein n=1 Tax=Chryseobacterium sp. BGARF1 TaxID=1664319 RepID=UPI000804F2A5|nr:hypothetical protein [Chryseobacterium sp. BGARF1]OBW39679.1 hypothetical protein AB670_03974 [Chryseobacterium sp. MOF25P]OBW43761.1 hypothetical protein AB671_04148 [Chryseobacterium sp. BGARF1]